MTSIINIPSRFYQSTDFFGPKEISREITRLYGEALPTLDQNVNQVVRESQELITVANIYLDNMNNNEILKSSTNLLANQVCLSTTSSLNSILGTTVTNGNQAAMVVHNSTNEALNAILSEGKTNENYNPADQVLNEINFALENIFGQNKKETTTTTAAQNISTNVNYSLDSILGKNETQTSTQSSTQAAAISNSVTSNLNTILSNNNEEVYANSGDSAKLFNYVNTNYKNIFNSNNGETNNTFAGSKVSYNLFASVHSLLDILFANPV